MHTAATVPDAGLCADPAKRASVFLPREHGSWSLALEPVALGLLVAPSRAGGALAAAAFCGFLARRPLMALVAGRRAQRTRDSALVLAFLLAATIAFAGIAALGNATALWPLLCAVPLGAVFAWFDVQGESRAIAAELSGSAAFAFVPVAMAAIAGWSAWLALPLAVLALSRSLPAILTVRAYLRVSRKQPAASWPPLLAAGFAAAAVILLAIWQHSPWYAAVGAVVLYARTLWLIGPLRPDLPARRIGQLEAALGLLYLGLIAIGYTR